MSVQVTRMHACVSQIRCNKDVIVIRDDSSSHAYENDSRYCNSATVRPSPEKALGTLHTMQLGHA